MIKYTIKPVTAGVITHEDQEQLGLQFEVLPGDVIKITGEEANLIQWMQRNNVTEITEQTALSFTGRKLTRLQFRNRFTQAEKEAIYAAAPANIAISVWLDDLACATEVDLDDPATVAGVNAICTALGTPARATEILE